jgi:hypothetical protein
VYVRKFLTENLVKIKETYTTMLEAEFHAYLEGDGLTSLFMSNSFYTTIKDERDKLMNDTAIF